MNTTTTRIRVSDLAYQPTQRMITEHALAYGDPARQFAIYDLILVRAGQGDPAAFAFIQEA